MEVDERILALCVILTTLAVNTCVTWTHLPYFPIEFSQMGWGNPGSAGGYHVMACGTCLTALILFPYHVRERSVVGCLGAVFSLFSGW